MDNYHQHVEDSSTRNVSHKNNQFHSKRISTVSNASKGRGIASFLSYGDNGAAGGTSGNTRGVSTSIMANRITSKNAIESQWTINDQTRLEALDDLHSRSRRFHDNVHSLNIDGAAIAKLEGEIGSESSANNFAFWVLQFPKEVSSSPNSSSPNSRSTSKPAAASSGVKSQSSVDSTTSTNPINANVNATHTNQQEQPEAILRPKEVSVGEADTVLKQTQLSANGIVWIHLQDLSTLHKVAAAFNINDLFCTLFADLRSTSNFFEIPGAFMLSLCLCRMQCVHEAIMNKVYIYVSEGLIVTFEHELLNDDHHNDHDHDDIAKDLLHVNSMDVDGGITMDVITTTVMHRVTHSRYTYDKVCDVGVAYIIVELALESIFVQDPIFEFLSLSISYYKGMLTMMREKQVKSFLYVKLRVLESCLVMLERQVSEALQSLAELNGLRSRNVSSIISRSDCRESVYFAGGQEFDINSIHRAYLLLIADSFKNKLENIQNELREARTIHDDMREMAGLRQAKTAVILSVVATVFLPLNFLTGMFGMNFQSLDGAYSLTILNSSDGIQVFFVICSVVITICICVFVYLGQIPTPISADRFVKWYHKWKRTEQSQKEEADKIEFLRDRRASAVRSKAESGALVPKRTSTSLRMSHSHGHSNNHRNSYTSSSSSSANMRSSTAAMRALRESSIGPNPKPTVATR